MNKNFKTQSGFVTAEQVAEWANQFPKDAIVYAYEGEWSCIVAVDAATHEPLGSCDAYGAYGLPPKKLGVK